MDISLIKNVYEWLKENLYFLFINEKPIKTANFTNNLIIFLSKHVSSKKLAHSICKEVLQNKDIPESMQKKVEVLKKELGKNNSNIGLITQDDEILVFKKYIKNNNLSLSDINIKIIYLFSKHLVNKIHYLQQLARITLVVSALLGYIFSKHYQNNSFMLLMTTVIFVILWAKSQQYYRLNQSLKSLSLQEVNFENSIYYQLVKEFDEKKFMEINKEKYLKEKQEENTNVKNKYKAEKEVFLKQVQTKNIEVEQLTENELEFFLETNEHGEFKLTTEIKNFENNKELLIMRIFNKSLEDDIKKSHLFHNIWKIIQNDTSANIIKKWFKSHLGNVSEIIDLTNNKMNVLHLFSTINKIKENLKKEPSKNKIAVIDNLDEIENMVFENMSVNNYLDIFDTIEKNQKADKPINIIKVKG